jgi:hypothetical protein
MLTRREFVGELAAGAVMAALGTRISALRPAAHAAVVSIHMDQPYIDRSGRALPYLPPPGMCAAAPVEHLSETEFRSRFVYL